MYALSVFSNASVFDKVTGLFLLTLLFVALKYDGMKEVMSNSLRQPERISTFELSLVLIPTTVTAVLYGYIKSEKSVPALPLYSV